MATASKTRQLTIGALCGMLKDEFPDISISKIRYLEDQGLVTPRRTQGGYRLFSEEDVERLETILRLQRDEFLPLRVIRQELASPAARDRKRRRGLGVEESELDLDELCDRAGIDVRLARELEDFGLLSPRPAGATHRGRAEALLRARSRHRARVRTPGALRDRAPPPAFLPDGSRSRGGSDRAGRRAGTSLPEPRAPPRGDGRPRGARLARSGAVEAPLLARAAAACVNMIR